MKRLIVLLALAGSIAGCGDGPPTMPSIAQVAGTWTGTTTLTGALGGECVGAGFQPVIGATDRLTVSLSQTGAAVSGTITLQSDGSSCTYAGTIAGNTLTLNRTTCQIGAHTGLQCASGDIRDARLVGGTMTGTVNGNTIAGTEAETWNVLVSGTQQSVGTLTLNTGFTITR